MAWARPGGGRQAGGSRTGIVMKRTFAVVILLASLGVLIKLAAKPKAPDRGLDRAAPTPDAGAGPVVGPPSDGAGLDSVGLLARYSTASPKVREMVARLSER